MYYSTKAIKHLFCIIILCFIDFSCAKKDSGEKILVRIGNKSISVTEFNSRAELTVRPPNFQSKRSVLNNLIAEKLLSLDASENVLSVQPRFLAFIKGIQEQKMRERLYELEAFEKIKITDDEIRKLYPLASREYALEYFYIINDSLADKIRQTVKTGKKSAREIFANFSQFGTGSMKKVKWKDPEADIIHNALFTQLLEPETVIGPLEIDDEGSLLMRVVGWKEYPAIGGEEAALRYQEVADKIRERKADTVWRAYIQKIMQGKEIKFQTGTFQKLAQLAWSIESASDRIQKQLASENRWQDDAGTVSDSITAQGPFCEAPFLSIGDEIWTVKDFETILMSHPLVYRKEKKDRHEFQVQFRYAVIDLVRDYYLTKAAYKKSLDKDPAVARETGMWKDALLASYQNEQYLISVMKSKKIAVGDMKTKDHYLQAHIDSLYHRYRDKIVIDTEAFNRIQLTRVSMFTIRQNVPYPLAVPGFPQLTTSDRTNIF